jgi:hypothetical protein
MTEGVETVAGSHGGGSPRAWQRTRAEVLTARGRVATSATCQVFPVTTSRGPTYLQSSALVGFEKSRFPPQSCILHTRRADQEWHGTQRPDPPERILSPQADFCDDTSDVLALVGFRWSWESPLSIQTGTFQSFGFAPTATTLMSTCFPDGTGTSTSTLRAFRPGGFILVHAWNSAPGRGLRPTTVN